ncbi:MAG TPA: cytochrome c biogenesis CcdA family protein [Candidatus Dietzia intestinipullorum]|nr:cytochrome c biogenesis CcdA family protein [Candidatus Dietzia intestinipullorum]
MDIGLLGAFLGGILTLLSPCSAMLLPAFFSYAFASPRELLTRTGVFYLGLITTLVPLGVLAGTLGAFVNEHRFTFVTIASVVVIALGALMLLNVPIPFLRRGSNTQGTSMTAVYALGTVYGLAGVCAGPLLGAVLTVAAVSGTPLSGGIIVLVFALGMTLPLLILSLLWGRFPAIRTLVRPREVKVGPWSNTWTGIIGGVLTIGVGILLLVTAGTTELTGFLGAGTQAELEGSVLGWAGQIPDIVVVLVVVAVAAVALLLVRSRKKRAPAASTAPDMPFPEVSMPLVGAGTNDDDDDETGSER